MNLAGAVVVAEENNDGAAVVVVLAPKPPKPVACKATAIRTDAQYNSKH